MQLIFLNSGFIAGSLRVSLVIDLGVLTNLGPGVLVFCDRPTLACNNFEVKEENKTLVVSHSNAYFTNKYQYSFSFKKQFSYPCTQTCLEIWNEVCSTST